MKKLRILSMCQWAGGFAQNKREVGCKRHAEGHMASLRDVGINSPRPIEQKHSAVLVESKLRGGWRTTLHGCRGEKKDAGRKAEGLAC